MATVAMAEISDLDAHGAWIETRRVTDDVTRTYNELSKRGVEFAGPPQTQEWGSYAIFKDPDGNAFVLGTK